VIASLPEKIRGFGHVKAASVERYRDELKKALEDYSSQRTDHNAEYNTEVNAEFKTEAHAEFSTDIGSKEEPLTSKQVIANADLIRHLCKKYKIEYVIGHSEYTMFRKSNLWKENNPNYITYKEDPGKKFLIELRELIADLNLKSKP
jgi:hypothetical protein